MSRWSFTKCRPGVLAAALLCCTGVAATELRTAAQEGTEPKFLKDPRTGAAAGICIDIMRAIERVDPGLHFSGEQRWLPLIRMYAGMDAGTLDAFCGLSHSPERDLKYRFVGPALFSVRYHLVARREDPVVIANWDDVRKLGADSVILANRGFGGVTILQDAGMHLIDASTGSPQLNVQKLVAHRGRFFFHRNPGLQVLLDSTGYGAKVRILPTEMARSALFFVVSKHVSADVAERLRAALLMLEKSGELESIARRWE